MRRPLLLCALLLAAAAASAPAQRFRVLQWNVSDSAWVKHADATRAVLRHADPDIVILDEVSEFLGEDAALAMLRGLRGPADTLWFVSVGAGGGRQHTVIASRDSVRTLPEFARVVTAAQGPLAAASAAPDSVQGHARRDVAESVGTNGALVRAGGRWLLVVGMDLTCCGVPYGWRESRRQLEASAIAASLRAAAARTSPAGVVAAGDMNLVSGRAPLDTLLAALPGMAVADAVHADGWSTWTWDGRGTPFNGGRLDVMIYSRGALRQLGGRIWDTEAMPADTLSVHGLEPGTSRSINRHRPVVVDFTW